MPLFLVLALVIAFFAIVFALQNPGYVALNLFTWTFQQSLALVLLLTLAFGIVIGLFVLIPATIKSSWKMSNQKKELKYLAENFQEKTEEIADLSQKNKDIKQNTQELLESLGFIDLTTGLLNRESVNRLISYLLQQTRYQKGSLRYSSVCVFLIDIAFSESNNDSYELSVGQMLQAIAKKLQLHARSTSWLHYYEGNQFVCITPGINSEASEYAEYLSNALVEHPIKTADGATIPFTVSIGSAIATADNQFDSQTLLQQANQAVQAKQRSRNPFRLF